MLNISRSGACQRILEARKQLHALLTKADKLNYGAAKNTLLKVEKELSETHVNVSIQLFSALKKQGIDDVHKVLDDWFSPAG